MRFKFIGKDGSMGLKYGKIYKVSIRTIQDQIWIFWIDDFPFAGCPYDSLQMLLTNWQEVL